MRNSDKTYGQLMLEAQAKTDRQEVGETVEPLMAQLQNIVEDCVQKQAEACFAKGFNLKKYYIHIFITKDPTAAQGFEAPNVIRIRAPHCRVTRPSPYQDQDHYLWSVTNLNEVKFEWCIPDRGTMTYILQNPSKFDPDYVRMLRKFSKDKLEHISDYLVDGKVI